MGQIHKGIPKELIAAIQQIAHYEHFVETGTYLGNSVIWAAGFFTKAYTIEILPELSNKAKDRHDCLQNIEFLVGDSREILNKIVPILSPKTVFWFDGHYSGEGTGGQGKECPVFDELEAIKTLQESIILIDDARFFFGPPPKGHKIEDWPRFDELIIKIKALFPNHYCTLHEDVIIACPEKFRNIIDQQWKMQFENRFSLASSKSHLSREIFQKIKNTWHSFKALKRQKGKKVFKSNLQLFLRQEKLTQKRFTFDVKSTFPQLSDATQTADFDRHYIYHPAWAARIIEKIHPEVHVDISSTLHFCSIISAFIPVEFYDFRRVRLELSKLIAKQENLTQLSFPDHSISSLSCMHTIEHIGLGRYGDKIDYDGDLKAMKELSRVLKFGGNLLVVVPIGDADQILFNAHRIYTKTSIENAFTEAGLSLVEFTLIPENPEDGGLILNPSKEILSKQHYGCGCFHFTK